ncbi:MAG: carboxypeptidase regulatory-like domain-containing protein, partial [Candidatus Edwardsbacteria bacterium]|nr:carboxypeptidase regulatory-like domain-containing protein [Candidatus Edwardsbacteria bacterium]
MRRHLLSAVLTFIALGLTFGATAGALRHPAGLSPVTITLTSHDDVYRLAQQGIYLEELRGLAAEARLTAAQAGLLAASGYQVRPRPDAEITRAQLTGYHNYSQMVSFLDSIRAKYPAITRKVSFGTTVEGRALWAFLITDNPDASENEAEVRLAANIHGDEVVGKELLLALIDSLTRSYGSNATITNYVNTREIWVVPCLNPDGLESGQRYNANGEDLNRDYPVPDGGSNGGSVPGTETETQQTMAFWSAKHAALSLVYHGGALVANYPWDYTTASCPDYAVARAAALGYAQLNAPMYNSSEFDDGVTNGAAWYVVRGSLQDWLYNATGGMDITVECSNTKWPSASTLPGYWNDNKAALLYYIRKAGEGIGGTVTDSATGQPLSGVTVSVTGISKAVTTDTPGDYHRLLTSGSYGLTFAKSGYASKTVGNVRVNFDSLTTLNVALKPASTTTPTLAISTTSWAPAAAGGTSSAVNVTNSGSTGVIAYTVASNQTWLTVSSSSGSTPGSFTMTATANSGGARSATVTVTATTAGVAGSPRTVAVSQAAGTSGQNDAGSGGDAGNTFATATQVSSGSWSGCYLDATDRNDYYSFSVTSGQVVKVRVTPPSSADYDLYLYNGSQTQLKSSTRSAGLVDSIVYTATVSGTFYAKAYQYSGTGNYSLLISVSGGTATPALAISSTSWAPAAAGGTSSAVNVTNSGSTSVIAYTVASNQTWLTVSSASGSTPGSFTMTAAANSGAARSATVTV